MWLPFAFPALPFDNPVARWYWYFAGRTLQVYTRFPFRALERLETTLVIVRIHVKTMPVFFHAIKIGQNPREYVVPDVFAGGLGELCLYHRDFFALTQMKEV